MAKQDEFEGFEEVEGAKLVKLDKPGKWVSGVYRGIVDQYKNEQGKEVPIHGFDQADGSQYRVFGSAVINRKLTEGLKGQVVKIMRGNPIAGSGKRGRQDAVDYKVGVKRSTTEKVPF